MNPPNNIFFEITTECNLKCLLCDLWKREDPLNRLTIINKLEILNMVLYCSELNNSDARQKSNIILTGGEPFLFSDQILRISSICKENGHNCYVNTNGSLIRPLIEKILDSGLTALTISIDSHHSKIHDGLRRTPGLYKSLIKTIKLLITEKQKNNSPVKICIQSIIGDWNIRELVEHVEVFESLGIDGINFQPIQYPFGRLIPDGWFRDLDYFPHSYEEIDFAIDSLLKFKNHNGFILNSVEEIKLFKQYFNNPESLPKSPCKAYEQNIIIDVYGNVKFCFNKSIEPLDKIGNILTSRIDEIINGREAVLIKKSMRNCNRACGIMSCHIDSKLKE